MSKAAETFSYIVSRFCCNKKIFNWNISINFTLRSQYSQQNSMPLGLRLLLTTDLSGLGVIAARSRQIVIGPIFRSLLESVLTLTHEPILYIKNAPLLFCGCTWLSLVDEDGRMGRQNFFMEPIAAGKAGAENSAATRFILKIHDIISSSLLRRRERGW